MADEALGDICADAGAEGMVSRWVLVGLVTESSIAEAWRVADEGLAEEGWLA